MYIFIMKLLYLLLPVVSAGLCDTNCQDIGRICTDLGTNYTCGCDESVGFWGDTVTDGETTCGKMRCDDANGDGTTGDDVNCGEHAICENDGDAGYTCTCEPGYTGSSPYNEPATCFPTCTVADCGANAICSDTDTGHTCACESGFAGEETVNIPATCVSQCAEDEYVSNHACKECSMLTRNSAGDLATGEDTACVTRDWVVATASALGGSVLGVGGVLVWHYSRV